MKSNLLILLFVSSCFSSFGQNTLGLTKLPASAFQLGNTWKTTDRITIQPFKPDAVTLSANTGEILVGNLGSMASASLESGDLLLQLDFMLSNGASCDFSLPNGTIIKLSDSELSGSIGSSLSSQYVGKSAGLWQKLQLLFRKQTTNESAKIEYLKLNDVVLHENIYLPKLGEGKSISFSPKKGTIALRNIEYQIQNESKPLKIKNLTYELHNGWLDKLENINAKNLIKKDTTSILTQEWGVGVRDYHVIYEGKMSVDKTADYLFSFNYMSHLFFEIDGKNILNFLWSDFSQKAVQKSVNLTAGEHTFRLIYHKSSWRGPALGVFVSASGVKPYPLHTLSSLPEPSPIPTIAINANGKPEMIRSFIQISGEKDKRTHAISVGFAQNIHYSLDLNQAALLQIWRGQFANATEMWHERGEPQLLTPLGMTQPLNGKSMIANLANLEAAWPDSLSNLQYKGYRLDATGTPEYSYKLADNEVKMMLVPEKGSFAIKLKTSKPTVGLFVRMAVANQIVEIEPGLFQIDGGQYFVNTTNRSILRTNNGKQELLLSLTDAANYSIIW